MKNFNQSFRANLSACVILLILLLIPSTLFATTSSELCRDANISLNKLYKSSPVAKSLSTVAKGVLVFPNVVKAGFMLGGQYGEGALLMDGKSNGYYNTVAASFGLQVGAQSFGYAMIFMTDNAIEYLNKTAGWEIGVGPTVTVVDKGVARALTTTTAKDDVYVFFYGQQGLMAGLDIQGSKITSITPGN